MGDEEENGNIQSPRVSYEITSDQLTMEGSLAEALGYDEVMQWHGNVVPAIAPPPLREVTLWEVHILQA